MEIRVKDKRVRGVCTVTISLVFNDYEKSKLDKFGYPEVEIGGQFDGFSLDPESKKLSEFPIQQRFDGVELGHDLAETRADTYGDTIEIRLKNVWDEFKAIPDAFGGEKVSTV